MAHRDDVTNHLDNRKGVFGNQLKTVVGSFLTGVNETEGGEPIEAIQGMKGIQDRIVTSMTLMATTNTLLRVIGENWARKYKS